jgi:hypothetical protein
MQKVGFFLRFEGDIAIRKGVLFWLRISARLRHGASAELLPAEVRTAA